ncbi:MAG: MCE family protein [Terrimonas sp.]|nr:MCE family protein [Terrimonas sp.]
MKISNETKVGILVIVGLTLLILGFNFLKGNDLINRQTKLYAVFSDLGSIQKSNPVKINGLEVGSVYDFKEIDKELTGIIITINMKRDVNIPVNSVATIESELLGTGYIDIKKGTGNEYLHNGDTLQTDKIASLLSSVTAQVNPTLGKMRESLDSLKMVMSSVNKIFDPNTKGNIQSIISNLMLSSASLQELLNTQTGALAQSLNNVSAITGNLKNNNDKVDSVLQNVQVATRKMADLDLAGTLEQVKTTIAQFKDVVGKIDSKDGSLGLLMNDKQLYINLNNTLVSLETLLDDVRVHPKRYVNVSVFGKKDKSGPLSSPTAKDSVVIEKN